MQVNEISLASVTFQHGQCWSEGLLPVLFWFRFSCYGVNACVLSSVTSILHLCFITIVTAHYKHSAMCSHYKYKLQMYDVCLLLLSYYFEDCKCFNRTKLVVERESFANKGIYNNFMCFNAKIPNKILTFQDNCCTLEEGNV